jgi:phenylacetate-CoA ligase
MMRPAVVSALPHLLRLSRVSRASMVERQRRALQRLVAGVGPRVPEVKQRLARAGLERVTNLADLRRLEPVERADLQVLDLTSRMMPGLDVTKLVRRQTGGSSGRPLVVYRTPLEEHFINLYRRRGLRLMGLTPRDRCVTLVWPGNAERKLLALGLRRFLGVYRDQLLIPDESLEAAANRLEEIRPSVLVSYPSILDKLVEDRRLSIRPRLVIAGGETLLPEVRRQVTEALGARVLNHYGMTECNQVAFECPTTGHLHIHDDAVLVEILHTSGEPAGEGEQGEVVVTSLHSYAMPFIRYRTGDIAIAGSTACECGLPLSTLFDLRGRVSDFMIAADGSWIHPVTLIGVMLRVLGDRVRQFQFVQETRTLMRLTLSTAEPLGDAIHTARSAIEAVLGAGVIVEIIDIGKQPIDRLGKHRTCISRVASIYDEYDPLPLSP